MKKLIIFSLILVGITVNVSAQKKIFLRLYKISGEKFAKGFFAGTTDTAVLILNDNVITSFPVNQIGTIKTKRSIGHTILVSSAIFGVSASILFAAGSSGTTTGFYTYSAGEGIAGGFLIGSAIGALVGAIIDASKKSQTFVIAGNAENWAMVKPVIDRLAVATISNNDQ